MNKIIMLSLLVLFTWSCQKEADYVAGEEKEYLVYDQTVECRPIETEYGFYLVSLKDSIPWLVHVDPSGKCNNLIDLSAYMDVDYDSIQNLNMSQMANGNIKVAFTYTDTESDNLSQMIQAYEFQKEGQVVDAFHEAIPSIGNNTYSFVGISKSEIMEWVVISSYSDFAVDPNAVSSISLQTSLYKASEEGYAIESTEQSFENNTIDDVFNIANNNMVILLAESASGPPDQVTGDSFFSLLTVLPDGTSNLKVLEYDFVSIEVIKQVEGGLLLTGTTSRSLDQTSLIVMGFDDENNSIWENNITLSASFCPTCIQVVNDECIIGGLTGDTREFSWNNVYAQTNNTLAMYAFDMEGQNLWELTKELEFSTLVLGVVVTEDGYSWLLSKESFGVYENMALLKTDNTGNIK